MIIIAPFQESLNKKYGLALYKCTRYHIIEEVNRVMITFYKFKLKKRGTLQVILQQVIKKKYI